MDVGIQDIAGKQDVLFIDNRDRIALTVAFAAVGSVNEPSRSPWKMHGSGVRKRDIWHPHFQIAKTHLQFKLARGHFGKFRLAVLLQRMPTPVARNDGQKRTLVSSLRGRRSLTKQSRAQLSRKDRAKLVSSSSPEGSEQSS